MKKLVAVLLSLLMIFSSLSVVGFAADEDSQVPGDISSILGSLTGDLDFGALAEMFKDLMESGEFDFSDLGIDLDMTDGMDVEMLIENETFAKSIDFLGFSAYDLYNTNLNPWAKISANNPLGIGRAEFSVIKASINTYLLNVLKKQIGTLATLKIYNADTGVKFIKFIGNLINADFTFEEADAAGYPFNSEKDFYASVVKLSGLADVIQHNWLDSNVNYTPVLTIFDYDFEDDALLGTYAKQKGEVVATVLLKSIIKRVLEVGPLEYMLRVVSQMASSYKMLMYRPLEALLISHINRGTIERDELKTMKGLFNLIVNGNNKDDAEHIQFITVPEARFASATGLFGNDTTSSTDTTDMFLYMLMYLNLVGMHKTNSGEDGAVEKFKTSITANLSGEDKEIVASIIGAFMQFDLASMLTSIGKIVADNATSIINPESPSSVFQTIMDFFTTIFTRIGDIIEQMIDSFLHFGQF